jgi:hypothetical protein
MIGYDTDKSVVKARNNTCGSFVDKVTLGQVFLGVLKVSLACIIEPNLHTYTVVCHQRYTL